MAKPEQVLVIDPPTELRFRGPFTTQVTSYLKLYNPIDKKVYFKIKTTAPKKYCVRPNSGVLEPNKGVEVAVSLQPFEYDPNEKNKHKFMVLSTIAPEGEHNIETIWSSLKPEDSMDSKLKCVFELPPDKEVAANEEPARLAEPKAALNKEPEPVVSSAREIKSIRADDSILRQENLELKEEVMRLKRSVAQMTVTSPAPGMQMVDEPQGIQPLTIVLGLICALCGIVLGKFFL